MYPAGLAAAAPGGWNAAPPAPAPAKPRSPRGLTSMKGEPPGAALGRPREEGRGPGGHAPRRHSAADWTRGIFALGFRAGEGKEAEPEHAPRFSVADDWPTESPRSILEGSLRSSHQGLAEDWLFPGWGAFSPGSRGCDLGGPPWAARYVGRRPGSRCGRSGRAGRQSPGAAGTRTRRATLGHGVVRSGHV